VKWKEYSYLVTSDLYRYYGKKDCYSFVCSYIFNPGFRYTFFMRSARYLKFKGTPCIPIYIFIRLLLNRYRFKYGISIPYNTDIGPGLYIGHSGGIVVNSDAVVGKNCNLSQGVTIGVTYGGKYPGVPVIGDNVYIGPGAFIIGGIEIGNYVAIGTGTVVNKPIPENAVVVSKPGEVISFKGSASYIVNIDY
jgi:serine O-acetyltransferase